MGMFAGGCKKKPDYVGLIKPLCSQGSMHITSLAFNMFNELMDVHGTLKTYNLFPLAA